MSLQGAIREHHTCSPRTVPEAARQLVLSASAGRALVTPSQGLPTSFPDKHHTPDQDKVLEANSQKPLLKAVCLETAPFARLLFLQELQALNLPSPSTLIFLKSIFRAIPMNTWSNASVQSQTPTTAPHWGPMGCCRWRKCSPAGTPLTSGSLRACWETETPNKLNKSK